ncbi:protein WHAT'S THIS FACTOR 1 homolog, chloroplastic-like [Arachis stenosperma]|uniref:protein WHAT'S THIS FACTOR 1 homolog, chloroplastic-like n=1 Tax=Arachis stenosperma TaxID=217475 RepID=UPI0025ABBE48|nr:protein WHAT'S THIS FACTOR 1 homolog, chloroplastic-like [Arachis stenosperma]
MLRHAPFRSSHGHFQCSPIWLLHTRQKSSGGSRPKKKVYHRVSDLDRVMELRKKPSLILELSSIIQSHKTQSLLLRDLEKNVGFVRKWDFMALIERYPTIFRVSGSPPSVSLTLKAQSVAQEEAQAKALMEPLLVNNLRKLLMLSVDCRVPLQTLEFVGPELGLPCDFRESLVPKYPHFFSVKRVAGKDCLELEDWDSSLAVTAREARLAQEGVLSANQSGVRIKVRISKDGNYMGPFAFKMNFPPGFRPNVSYLENLERWQRMDFPSPYLNARRLDPTALETRKRAVAVIHELLSLTMEKRMTSVQLDAFQAECRLPSKLLLCLIKHHGIFYLTNKGVRSTVFLKDAYLGSNLIDKCPLSRFNDKFAALSGRTNMDLCNSNSSIGAIV